MHAEQGDAQVYKRYGASRQADPEPRKANGARSAEPQRRRPASGTNPRAARPSGARPREQYRQGAAPSPSAGSRARATGDRAYRGTSSGASYGPSGVGRRATLQKGPRLTPGQRWIRLPAKLRLALVILIAGLMVWGAVKVITRALPQRDNREVFVENVSLNGVYLAGLTKDEGYQTIVEKTSAWLNSTYALTYGDRSWDFTPSAFGASLSFDEEFERAWNLGHVGDAATRQQVIEGLKEAPQDIACPISYDESALKAFVSGIADEIYLVPMDAEVTLAEDRPVISRQSQDGKKLDEEKTLENLVALIATGTGDTQLPVEDIAPMVQSDAMQMRTIAKFSTDVSFRNVASRGNVRLALNFFNLLTVNPGDTVSFNEIVGPRTEARGFKEAPEYAGNETTTGIGGGVCQASTTLYNAVIQAGMDVIERHRHQMTVSYVEPSQDAAVEYGSKDFVFRNSTEHPIYIYTNVSADTASVVIYGARPPYHYELESVVLHEEKSNRKRYEYDMSGKYVYYVTDSPKLQKEGRGSCESEGWIVSYDWDTQAEVSRERYSHDSYRPGVSVYWRGVHDVNGDVVLDTSQQ